MARFNEILTGRYNRFLQKLLSMKGGPVAAQLGSEVSPVFPFFNGKENRFLEGWGTYWAAVAGIVGAAGNNPTFRMTNDFGSNTIAVIEKLLVGTVAADKVDISFQNQQPLVGGHVPDLSLLPYFSIDGRPGASGVSQGQGVLHLSTSTLTNTAGQLVQKRQTQAGIDVDIIWFEDQEIIMSPQSLLNIFSEALASTLFVSVMWRERYLEDSERF